MKKKKVTDKTPAGHLHVWLTLPVADQQRLRIAAATVGMPMSEFCRLAALGAVRQVETGENPFADR